MLGARQRERGWVELAELQVRERRRPRHGPAPRRRRSPPRGSWSGATARRRRPSRAPWRTPRSPPHRSRRRRRRSPSLQSASTEVCSSTPMRSSAPTSSARRLVMRAPGLAPRRRGRCAGPSARPPGRGRGRRPDPGRSATPRSRSSATAAGASLARTSTASDRQSPRPALSVSCACAGGRVVGGERRRQATLGPEARALGERLSRDERHGRAVLGRPQRDVEAGGPAADDHDVGFG